MKRSPLLLLLYICTTFATSPQFSPRQIKALKQTISKIEKISLNSKQLDQDFKELFVAEELPNDSTNWKQCWTFYIDFQHQINRQTYVNWRSCLASICNQDCMTSKKEHYLSLFDKALQGGK